MYRLCRHVKANGIRCQSPALTGAHFCYYHSKVHTIGAEPNAKFGSLQLPAPENPAAIQLSVARISDAIINGRIDQKKAASLLYALQIAAPFINRRETSSNVVESAELAPDGDELAPDEYVCRVDDNCDKCARFAACPQQRHLKRKKHEEKKNDHEDEDKNDAPGE